jgi:hypothetical protein
MENADSAREELERLEGRIKTAVGSLWIDAESASIFHGIVVAFECELSKGGFSDSAERRIRGDVSEYKELLCLSSESIAFLSSYLQRFIDSNRGTKMISHEGYAGDRLRNLVMLAEEAVKKSRPALDIARSYETRKMGYLV